jgi:hypothetical protein
MKQNILLILLSIVIWTAACVEPFDITLTSKKIILVVDGTLSDQDEPQVITLKKTQPNTGYISYLAEREAKVVVIENGTARYNCTEEGLGRYVLPAGFKPKVNSEYALSIVLKDGTEYLSGAEKMKPVPEIDTVYSEVSIGDIPYRSSKVNGNKVYLNTEDFKETGDNYLWNWKLYERQTYCASCLEGLYYNTPPPEGRCVGSSGLLGTGIIYDYFCPGDCWEIYYQDYINVMSDTYSNGNKITGRLIAEIPLYQTSGALLEIKQQSVTPTSFRYLKLLAEQSQGTGSLADTPPAALVGNIKNIKDPYESVGGYFMVSSSRTAYFWINRNNVPGNTTGLFGGRSANPEPPTPPFRPPAAPCIKSKTRTPDKPRGWVDPQV